MQSPSPEFVQDQAVQVKSNTWVRVHVLGRQWQFYVLRRRMARILSREHSIASDAIEAFSDLARRMGYSCAKLCKVRSTSFLHESASVRRVFILDASSLKRAKQNIQDIIH